MKSRHSIYLDYIKPKSVAIPRHKATLIQFHNSSIHNYRQAGREGVHLRHVVTRAHPTPSSLPGPCRIWSGPCPLINAAAKEAAPTATAGTDPTGLGVIVVAVPAPATA